MRVYIYLLNMRFSRRKYNCNFSIMRISDLREMEESRARLTSRGLDVLALSLVPTAPRMRTICDRDSNSLDRCVLSLRREYYIYAVLLRGGRRNLPSRKFFFTMPSVRRCTNSANRPTCIYILEPHLATTSGKKG